MSENNISVQAAVATPTHLYLNGSEATAQQIYDAFMGGPIRLDAEKGMILVPTELYWENEDGTQTNPAAVTYVQVFTSRSAIKITAGTKYTAEVE